MSSSDQAILQARRQPPIEAVVIGTSGQTADVAFSNAAMRRIGTWHCVLSFAFNTTVLALMINIAASLM